MAEIKSKFRSGPLLSGGLITDYHCTSSCRHCLYRSGPRRSKAYIDEATAAAMLRLIRQKKCRSVHIGGGEPLLNPDRQGCDSTGEMQPGEFYQQIEMPQWPSGLLLDLPVEGRDVAQGGHHVLK